MTCTYNTSMELYKCLLEYGFNVFSYCYGGKYLNPEHAVFI